MAEAQVWTLIGLLAMALFALVVQIRGSERSLSARIGALTAEMHPRFRGVSW